MTINPPPPRLVPDRPSDAVRAKLQRIREAGQSLGKLLGDGQPHSDFLATIVGQSALALEMLGEDWREAMPKTQLDRLSRILPELDAAAPPAEAPAERGDSIARIEVAARNATFTTSLGSAHDCLRKIAKRLAQLAAAPAGEAIAVEVYSIHDGVGTFNCPSFVNVGDKLYTAPRVTGGREDSAGGDA